MSILLKSWYKCNHGDREILHSAPECSEEGCPGKFERRYFFNVKLKDKKYHTLDDEEIAHFKSGDFLYLQGRKLKILSMKVYKAGDIFYVGVDLDGLEFMSECRVEMVPWICPVCDGTQYARGSYSNNCLFCTVNFGSPEKFNKASIHNNRLRGNKYELQETSKI